MKRLILFALLATSLLGCASADDNEPAYTYNPVIAPENENQLVDLAYGDDPQQRMDLYLPAGRITDKTKVFIVIHGGGWFEGDKADMNFEIIMLKNTFPDYAIANINYRLGTKQSLGFPKQINDVQKVVAFLNSKYKDFHISKQYAMIGMSAGAHLSMLYAYKYNSNNQVKAVCSIVGPADFSDPQYEGNQLFTKGVNYLVGEYPTYQDNPSIFNAVSPVKQITPKAPKTIMFYGDEDPLVPNTQGGRIQAKLNQYHVYNEYYKYEGAGHANWTQEQLTDVNLKTVNFFRAYFKP